MNNSYFVEALNITTISFYRLMIGIGLSCLGVLGYIKLMLTEEANDINGNIKLSDFFKNNEFSSFLISPTDTTYAYNCNKGTRD